MQGSLKQVPLPEVLQFISMGKSSGVLRLKREKVEITLTIKNGKIVNSSSIDRRRRLGDLLVNRGLLKRSELSRLLNLQQTVESDKRLGQILVEREIVSEDRIRETLRLQLEEEIWNLFSWQDGEFNFDALEEDRLGDDIVEIDIEPLILEGTRRNDEWQKILQVIPHDRMVPQVVTVGDDFARQFALRPAEWQVLSQVNGRFTIRAIVNRSNLGRFEAHMILSHFIKSGLVELKEEVPFGRNGASEDGLDDDDHPIRVARVGDEKSRHGGLLSSLMGARGKDRGGERGTLTFVSPLSAVAYFINEFMRLIMEAKEYQQAEGDEILLDRVWYDLVQNFTRADLIAVKRNRIETKLLETYLAECEFKEYVDEVYEDALEGLINLNQTAYRIFNNRIGERATSKVARELLDDLGPRVGVKYREPFPFVERIASDLGLS